MTNYCTLDDAKNELKAQTTVDDAKLRNYIGIVSKRIDSTMGSRRRPFFAPYTEQRRYLLTTQRVDSFNNTFWMDDFILALSSVVRGGETITANVEIYTADNRLADSLRITNWTTGWYDSCDGTTSDRPPSFVLVTGIWGWHEDYDNAYDAVDTLAANALIGATSITVVDADAADLDGFTPRFSPGNLIKINDELMDITAVNTTTNVVTVHRARNGTTATAHTSGDSVSTYQVDERIRRIATRQSALLYARKGAFQVETLDGVGSISYPQDLLAELKATLQDFQYA